MSNRVSITLLPKEQSPTVVDWLRRITRHEKTGIDRKWFFACLIFIIGVSTYDTYLVVLYRESILDDERNPICELLIRKDPLQLSWFLLGKILGNIFVVGTLVALDRFGYRRSMTIATSVALFQFWLLVFLNFSDPLTGFLYFDGLFSHDPKQFAQGLSSAVIHGVVTIGLLMFSILTRIWWKSIRNSSRALGTA